MAHTRLRIRRVLAAYLRAQATHADKQAWQLEQMLVKLPCLADTSEELAVVIQKLRALAKRLRRTADTQQAKSKPVQI